MLQTPTDKHRRDSIMTCPAELTNSGKGSFSWPETVAGEVAIGQCPMAKTPSKTTASRRCNTNGIWLSVDNTNCSYESETTANLDMIHDVRLKLLLD